MDQSEFHRNGADAYAGGPACRNDLRSFFPLEFYERHRRVLASGFFGNHPETDGPNIMRQYLQQRTPMEHCPPSQPPHVVQNDYCTMENPFQGYRQLRPDVQPPAPNPEEIVTKNEMIIPNENYGNSCDSFERRGTPCEYQDFKMNFPIPTQPVENGHQFMNGRPQQVDFKNENTINGMDPIIIGVQSVKEEYATVCWKCNFTFSNENDLREHYKICSIDMNNPDGGRMQAEQTAEKSEGENKGRYSCETCLLVCQSPAILKIHERVHSGEKPFACSFCDYKSGQKNNVAKHLLVHMKKKPYGCQYCDYRCAQKNNLVIHERTHTGFKPFACTFCEYKTVQKPNLVKHMYLHTNEKPFACDVCDYRCVQKTNLTKHKQKHTMEKPFACPSCDYKCSQKSNLQKHQLIHKKYDNANNVNNETCEYCPFRCPSKDDLNKHMEEQHKMLKQEYIENSFETKPYIKQFIS